MPTEEACRRVVIAWRIPRDKVAQHAKKPLDKTSIIFERGEGYGAHITLRGSDMQSTLHMGDYLLDLTNAPLHGRVPLDVVFTVLRREWEGIRMMKELESLTDEEAFSKPERPRNSHKFDQAEWAARVRRMVNPNTYGQSDISGPLIAYSNLLLKRLPLPDGRTLGLGT